MEQIIFDIDENNCFFIKYSPKQVMNLSFDERQKLLKKLEQTTDEEFELVEAFGHEDFID